mmetsp:Transcript_54458/g.153358  ORF Transcript_54458/g.153358 Transcript_54458/m.153358 type:complete len:342 (+) Transcript_54458:209-1234(+)
MDVAPALRGRGGEGARAADLVDLTGLHAHHGDARAAAVGAAGDLGHGVAGLKVLRVLLPPHPPVFELLGHNGVLRGSLQHDIVPVRRGRWPLRPGLPPAARPGRLRRRGVAGPGILDVLCDLHNLLVHDRTRPGASRGSLNPGMVGEDHPDDLLPAVRLGAPHLQVADAKDAETRPVLRPLVEQRRRGAQRALQPGRFGAHRPTPLRGRGPAQWHPPQRPPGPDPDGGGPRGREQGAGVASCEAPAQEMFHPSLLHLPLPPHEVAQRGDVLAAGVRRDEQVALLAPVGQARVEEEPEEVPVLVLKHRPGAAVQVGPKGATHHSLHVGRLGILASGVNLPGR